MPPEAEIVDPPAEVAAEVAQIRTAVGQVVPAKQANTNLLIGTWNLRAFGDLTKAWASSKGDSPKRNYRDVQDIAAVVSHFDTAASSSTAGAAPCTRSPAIAAAEAAAATATARRSGPSISRKVDCSPVRA